MLLCLVALSSTNLFFWRVLGLHPGPRTGGGREVGFFRSLGVSETCSFWIGMPGGLGSVEDSASSAFEDVKRGY